MVENDEPVYWQVAAGDTRRDYANLCLDWGVILSGPGDPGPWSGGRDKYQPQDYGAQRVADLARFCDTIKPADRVILNLGQSTVYGLGVIFGSYDWNDHFGDIDGWDVQHFRRVNWFWKRGIGDPAPPFETREFKRGTTQILGSDRARIWFDQEWAKAGEPNGGSASLPMLPTEPPVQTTVESIGDSLFDQGIGASSISETIARIADIKRLADWYWRAGNSPSESETIAHLVVPLLQTLGWTSQRLAVEWNKVDLALFDALPRIDDHLSTLVEVKKKDEACLTAKSQAEGYALANGRERCRRLVVTDGMRYGMFIRRKDRSFPDYPDAYMNLRRLIKDYPLLRSPTDSNGSENGAARVMSLMSADLRV